MTKPKVIDKNSVVLASGGARGITAQCVVQLAQAFPAHYLLLGRTAIDQVLPDWAEADLDDKELKERIMVELVERDEKTTLRRIENRFKQIRAQQEVQATLAQITQTGATVDYIQADVTEADVLRERLSLPIQKYGPVSGIIHGAGALADRKIEKKSQEDFDRVTEPKIDGFKNLLTMAPVQSLDFLILFSSIVGVFGNIGQTDYALANEVLNKAAYQAKRENPDCRVISINWGPWETGMVTPELKRLFTARGMALVSAESGPQAMVDELTSPRTTQADPVQIIIGAIPTRPAQALSDVLKTHKISRQLSLKANPFLSDHKIGDHPVLPATCAAAWIANSCEQLYPGYSLFQMDNFKVLKGIIFNETLASEHWLEIAETEKISGEKIQCTAKIFSQRRDGKPLFHYTADLVLLAEVPPAPSHRLRDQLNNLEQEQIRSDALYQDGTLFHGPAFQGVRRVLDIDKNGLVLECFLPAMAPADQGQFSAHTANPFMNDTIVQSLLIWTQHFLQMPCLPSHLEQLTQYRPVVFDQRYLVNMQVIAQTETAIVADIYVTDEEGILYEKFTRLQGTISPLLNRFIGSKTNQKVSPTNA
ncbi:MAG: SDR family NAD(P)-dependent oxidoreductase [Brevefilum sp.]|nr:SDR family NAD(P)-dependent oxidoreductase [Brevefilum sp.]MDW7754986.1 SDR family NAD(P)-dependent oxidoreductase [Brevefilum sp.]